MRIYSDHRANSGCVCFVDSFWLNDGQPSNASRIGPEKRARIDLPETDDSTPMFVILRPSFAAGEIRQQALIARVTGGMVASPN